MRHLLTIALVAAALALALPQRATAQDRYPALTPEQMTPEQKAYSESIAKPPRNANFRNPPYRVFIRSPKLAERVEALSDYVRWGTDQPARLTELAIMITARHWSSAWIWRSHYRLAVKGGLDPKVGADIAAGKRPETMKEDETILYDYAMQLYRDNRVTDAMFAKAVAKFGERGLIDLVATMGYYDLVAKTLMTANAIPPKEADVPELLPLTR
jgi:4-carboxymuconolactone decarboxylase